MPRKITPAKIYRQRRDNYVSHFESRAQFKALPLELQLLYQKWSAVLPRPVLNVWGAGGYTEDEMNAIIHLAINKGLPDVWMLFPWYVSEEGWEDFQTQWKNLPDVIHSVPVDEIGQYLYSEQLVHISTGVGTTFKDFSTD